MSYSFIKLSCANCGAKLDVYEDMDRFACGYCGTEMFVQRRGGTVLLKALAEAIQKVQIGTDKTAAELALIRLDKELREAKASQSEVREKLDKSGSGIGGLGVFLVVMGLLLFSRLDNPALASVCGLALLLVAGFFVYNINAANKKVWTRQLVARSAKIVDIEKAIEKNRSVVQAN